MKINKIKIVNFGSYKNAEISFNSETLIGIIGKNIDSEKSIGTGKSTFLESIIFALYGVYKKLDLSNAVHKGEKYAEVTVDFHMSGKEYKIYRRTDIGKKGNSKTKLELIQDGNVLNKGATDGKEMINNIIGVDYEIFTAISFFVQDRVDDFVNAIPSKKLEYLSILCELDVFENARKLVNEDVKRIVSEKTKLMTIYDHVRSETSMFSLEGTEEERQEKIQELKKDIGLYRKGIKDNEEAKRKLEKKREFENQKSILSLNFENVQKDIRNAQDIIDECNSVVDNNIDVLKFCLNQNEEIASSIRGEISDINMYIYGEKLTKDQINSIQDEINEIDNFDTCDKCGMKMNEERKSFLKKGLLKKLNELKENSFDIDGLEKKKDRLLLEVEIVDEKIMNQKIDVNNKNQNSDKLQKAIREKVRLSDIELVVAKNIKNNERKMFEIGEIKIDETDYYSLQLTANNEINTLKSEIVKIQENNSKKMKINELEKQIKELSDKEHKLNIIANSFSKNEIPKRIISDMLDYIESYSNELLFELLDDHSIKFVTEQKNKSGKVSGTLNIIVNDGDVERDFSSFSGGERTLINFALRFAISKYLSQKNSRSIELVVLDEVFGALGEYSMHKAYKILSMISGEFSQIFNITHDPLVQDIFPNMLQVVKSGSESKIGWA